ncbi:MAG: hypothetical protein K5663_03050 [Clostridiales bacterium]|nr:hypothetical protein [Clostridiales bacterium]
MKRFLVLFLVMLSLSPYCCAQDKFVYPEEKIPARPILVPFAEGIYRVDRMDRLVNDCTNYKPELMSEAIQSLNVMLDSMDPHIPVYCYMVENSRTHPMSSSFPEDSLTYLYLKENLHADVFDHLKYTSFKQFCEYFYTTDHHWNCRGSYQGYLDVVRMLKGESERVLVPEEYVTLPVLYDGTYSRQAQTVFSKEYFSLYRYDHYPEYTAYVNDKRRAYDHIQNYLNGKISENPLYNHYALCYGGDYGLVVFENNKPSGKGTLLLFGDSQSNAVKTMLIEHFDKIIYVDLRHYSTTRGVEKPFSLKEFTSQYQIDQILFLSEVSLYLNCGPANP